MTLSPSSAERLRFLARVVDKETRHLALTTGRLFTAPFTPERVAELEKAPDLAERVDAFVSRFGRLQDTLGDKLLPVLLTTGATKAMTGFCLPSFPRSSVGMHGRTLQRP